MIHMAPLQREEQGKLIIYHTPEWWLPTASPAVAIFRGRDQKFLSYETGGFVRSYPIVWKNDALFQTEWWWYHSK